MIKIKDLSDVVNDDVLEDIYQTRYEKVLTLSDVDKKLLEQLYKKRRGVINNLETLLNSLPDMFEETRKQINDFIESHTECNTIISSYFDEKLYKSGLLDGMKLALEYKKAK